LRLDGGTHSEAALLHGLARANIGLIAQFYIGTRATSISTALHGPAYNPAHG
jgi:hypothetical protein